MDRKLRFGVLLDAESMKQWQYEVIEKLIASGRAEPALVILNSSSHSKTPISYLLKHGLFFLYKKLFASPKALRGKALHFALEQVPSMRCETVRKGKFSEYFQEGDLEQIRSQNLDFVLRFGFGIIRGKIHQTAKYGIWSFHHGDEQKYRGGPYGFWEVYKQERLTGAILQRLTDKLDAGIVLKKGQFPTVRYSFKANINMILNESTYWPVQVCADIQNEVAHYLTSEASKTTAKIYKLPTNLVMTGFVLKQPARLFAYWWKKASNWDQWAVGIVNRPIEKIIENNGIENDWVEWIPEEKGAFIADPSIHNNNGNLQLLCERLDYENPSGYLVRIDKFHSGNYYQTELVKNGIHHSYPRVYTENGKRYLIPEVSELGKVLAYPYLHDTVDYKNPIILLDNFKGIDPTLVHYENKWWMFVTELYNGHSYKLQIYSSKNLLGPWAPHANNPVKYDVKAGRGGGGIFLLNGQLYRPAQDYSETHEWALNLYKITKLTQHEFEEEYVCNVGPILGSRYPHKIHTIDVNAGKVVIDACREINVLLQPRLIKLKWDILKKKKN